MTEDPRASRGAPIPAVALIDGEHYPPVVVDALDRLGLRFDFMAAVFLGGSEKIDSGDATATAREIYGLPVYFARGAGSDVTAVLTEVIDKYRPHTVVDVSDEPVVGYRERFRLISHALARNVSYEGSDFRFSPPKLDHLATNPSLSIIGTAKRVGKTALSGFAARTIQEHLSLVREGRQLDSGRDDVVIVPMGRGGPAAPEVIHGAGRALEAGDLLEWSRAGRHAASDHFEDAALSRVTTVGCRRCGGGMAGEPFVSNVAEGARIANSLSPSLTIFEGSGAAMPPVATDVRLLVAGAHQPLDYVAGYLGTYRVLMSDAVVLTMAEEPLAEVEQVRRMAAEIDVIKPGILVIPAVFRPRPLGDVAGRSAAFFSTAPPVQEGVLCRHLEQTYGCRVVAFSPNLSDRARLRADLGREDVRAADLFLTEIKAAAIDVVAEEADMRGVETVFVDNIPIEADPSRTGELAEMCRELARQAMERFDGR
ncbi:MAG: 2,3-diphosphoglycerate synthetase [Thermoleophilia bacterium]